MSNKYWRFFIGASSGHSLKPYAVFNRDPGFIGFSLEMLKLAICFEWCWGDA